MGQEVNVLCRNFQDDRVIPRFSRYLADLLGWDLTSWPRPGADVYYLSGYFEHNFMIKDLPKGAKIAAYFTHKEEMPPGNAKARMFDRVAGLVDLRIATAGIYASQLLNFGATAQIAPPVERSRFTIPKRAKNRRLTAGFSGYTYANKRKGENLAKSVINSPIGKKLSWKASGRGWPVPTVKYPWRDMAAFYQSLDILVITATVEGVPMPPLEALSCGVSVVIPRGVGLLDELPESVGVHRYKRGSAESLVMALSEAVELRSQVEREALREITAPYTIGAWCDQHREAFNEIFFN